MSRLRATTTDTVLLVFVSAAVIALQIVLVRTLSFSSYHHFVYLVVSTALLGFGASGTVLALLGERAERGFGWIVLGSLWVLALVAWTLRVALAVPVDLYYLLYDLGEAGRLWVATLVLAVPFFAGGLLVGAILRRHRDRPGPTYAANLAGSGAGGVGVLPLLAVADPEAIVAAIGVLAAGASVAWLALGGASAAKRAPRVLSAAGCAAAVAVSALAAVLAWSPPVDQYKGLAFARRLAAQGDAALVAETRSPIARWHVYDAPSMHYTLFASPGSPPPPPQLQVFRDGFLAGALFRIVEANEAPILDHLPQSLPYAALERPDVLILGETSGVNVWVALRNGARSVTVVHRDEEFVRAMTGPSGPPGGHVFARERVRVVALDPRTALAQLFGPFDLIHIAEAEGTPAAGAGLVSLQEDYLLTTEAISQARALLRPDGLISVTRGLYSPPRDNLRLVSLFAASLRADAVHRPGDHVVQARNYLAATTLLSCDPLSAVRAERLVARANALRMDVDSFPNITTDDLTEINRIDGPPGETGSYLYHGARALLNQSEGRFADRWIYDLSPPTDDAPYFHNFFRLRSLSTYIESYGHLWFSRLELGPVVVAATLVQATVAGALLVLVPILVARRTRAHGAAGWTVVHFLAIGLGFMGLEMLFIQKGTLILGDPVYSAAAVITAILVWAGVGSAVEGRVRIAAAGRIAVAAAAVVVLGAATLVGMDAVQPLLATAAGVVRFAALLVALGPVSFAMGWLFPAGVERLGEREGEVGLALAVNGVASVVAAPLAVLVSSGLGFPALLGGALSCYAIAGLVSLYSTTTRRP
ncbi:MAG: hypothetical protein ACOC2Y_05070 [Spirochaetota bacterium]